MQAADLRPKKRLGQNFLCDPGAIHKIVAGLKLDPEDVVLEIGCGTGALTREIVGRVRAFVGIELDPTLFKRLRDRFAGAHVTFLNQDVLKADLSEIRRLHCDQTGKLKVVGNLPYYVSSPIVSFLARYAGGWQLAVIMLQTEVADRLVAKPGSKDYGVLSLIAQYYFAVQPLLSVHPRAFRPVPNVYSTVVRLTPKASRTLFENEEQDFFAFVKRSFSQRRKTLRNAVKGFPGLRLKELGIALEELHYPANVRAEAISLTDFVKLFRRLNAVRIH